ncbi:SHOCT domain-containing protein [Lentimicrobium sp. L6]|uniref:SHOCT domain-containing protein n=1 Tax=Lentimicrobium sp. L6 TaxID=2735916 RepID=UPI001554BAB1|nr:SHOCT domain-containing protein [Lentimicrobium sp. L6]NPD85345.1 SHOCT domain-containing protein [Lentimicrobium sp. L6]
MEGGDVLEYLFYNTIGSIIVSIIGSYRKIGGGKAFLISFILNSIIGFVIVILSKSLKDSEDEKQIQEESINLQREAIEEQRKMNQKTDASNMTEQLERLAKLKKEGILNEEEFQKAKKKLID